MEARKMIEEASGNKPAMPCSCLYISGTNDSARARIILTKKIDVVALCRNETTLTFKTSKGQSTGIGG